MKFSAYLFIVHGSRDSNYQIMLQQLTTIIQQKIIEKKINLFPLVKTVYLELADISLSQSIINFSLEALSKKHHLIKIMPLFLLSGVHVKEDIPIQISIARQNLPKQIYLELMPHLGSYDQILTILARKFAQFKAEKKILLAHGSNFENGNQECENITKKLNIDIAYWSITPNIREKVAYLANIGVKSIVIVPYFLFEGRITKAIAIIIEELNREYSEIKFYLDSTLASSLELANLIVQELSVNN